MSPLFFFLRVSILAKNEITNADKICFPRRRRNPVDLYIGVPLIMDKNSAVSRCSVLGIVMNFYGLRRYHVGRVGVARQGKLH